MTLILGLALCLLAVIGAYFAGRWGEYDRGFRAGVEAASGRPVTPLRPKAEPTRTTPKRIPTWKRGRDGAS